MKSGWWKFSSVLALVIGCLGSVAAQDRTPLQLLEELDEFPHALQIEYSETDVLDYEVGLDAIQKFSGDWRFEASERFSGVLTRYTWLLKDGFTSIELMNKLLEQVDSLKAKTLLFSCDARACGKSVQWANKVFEKRVLYGRADMQRYRVFRIGETPQYLLLIYASARMTDRQYLHTEVLEIAES